MSESPNYVAAFIDAQDAGRKMAQRRAVQNALAMADKDPAGAQSALMSAGALDEAAAVGRIGQQRQDQQLRAQVAPQIQSGDYAGAQQTAAAGGDFELAKTLNGMHDDQLKQVEHHTQVLGGIAHYLSTVQDPKQRQALWAETAPHLIQQGLMKPEEAQSVDLSDNGLHAYEAQAIDIKTQIANEFKARQAQMEADKFDETKRHNRVDETVAQGHLGVARGQLGVAQGNLAERRKEGVATSGGGKWEPIP